MIPMRFESPGHAESALADYAAIVGGRDELVLAALAAGLSKHRIYVLSGIARTTIDDIIARNGEAGEPQMTTYQTRAGEITANEARVLRGIDGAYAYQPPAALLGAARSLLERGIIEQAPGFPAVLQIADINVWHEVQDADYLAEEIARDKRDQARRR